MKRIKRIKLLATRKDGFTVNGHFKQVSINCADYNDQVWVSADGREFVCDQVEIKIRGRGMGEGNGEAL